MAVQVSYPGVYIQEIPSGVRTITGVSTSVAMFVGFAKSGPLNKPTLLFSFSDYQRAFGTDTSASEMATQVRLFFQNGGERCYVMRIAQGAGAATLTMKNEAEDDTLRLTARNPGSAGNRIRAEVDYATPAPNSTFNLRVFIETETTPGVFSPSAIESYVGLSMDPNSPRFVDAVLGSDSNLVTAEALSTAEIDGASYSDRLFVDNDAVKTAITDVFPTRSSFRISIDGGLTFSPVEITSTVPADGTEILEDAIEAAIGAGVVTVALVSLDAGAVSTVRIQPVTSGAVVILPSADPTNDIAVTLGLGATYGGIEFGAFANLRPAPTGSSYTPGHDLAKLNTLAAKTDVTLTELEVADTASGSPHAVVFTLTPVGKLYAGGVTSYASYTNVRDKLNQIASAVNAAAALDVNFNWAADVEDIALILRPVGSQPANFTGAITTDAPTLEFAQNARFFTVGLGGLPATFQSGIAGTDGSTPTSPAAYDAAYAIIDGEVDLFNILLLPRAAGLSEAERLALWGPASVFCQRRRAFLLIDPPTDWKTVADILSGLGTTIAKLRQGVIKDHAAVYWPRVTAVDGVTGLSVKVDPSGSIAGIMARTDGSRGVWKAPAGIEADVRGVQGLEKMISDPENGVINPQAVNAIRVFPNGIIVWGARTMDGFDNSGNTDYSYTPVRRFALFIEESLVRGLKFAVFEPNGEQLWAQIRLAAGAFMNNLFRQGAFAGTKTSDAYFVLCDSTTTPQNDINLGIVNVVIGFAPLKPAEFVMITLQQKAGEIQV